MKTNDNQYYIYLRATKQRIPCTKEQFDDYYRDINAYRRTQQNHGRCVCPQSKVWACDGDCLICEYRRSGNLASLDVPIGKEGEDTLMDMVPSEAPAIESIIADRDLLDRLFARLRELDPDADTIIAMWMDDDNVSDRAIAKALGRPQRTFADQMKKYRTELRRIRGF